MAWNDTIVAAHLAVTDAVSHAQAIKADRYFVWIEDGLDDLLAENGHTEAAVTGSTDLYTKMELDPWAAALGKSFDDFGILWTMTGVTYEQETGFWHWSWDWVVV